MYFITIDPGLGGTGYAVFNTNPGTFAPIYTGVAKSKSSEGKDWANRQTEIMNNFQDNLVDTHYNSTKGWNIEKAYIELPAMFESAKGMTCATGENGQDSSLIKLAVLVGRLYEAFDGESIAVEFIRVNDWKGTLPKKAVSARIQERLKLAGSGIAEYGDHACDAVGMGLWVKGVFQPNTGRGFGNGIPAKRNFRP